MADSAAHEAARNRLREDVKLMRLLGVLQWRGIVIGPEPIAEVAAPSLRALKPKSPLRRVSGEILPYDDRG